MENNSVATFLRDAERREHPASAFLAECERLGILQHRDYKPEPYYPLEDTLARLDKAQRPFGYLTIEDLAEMLLDHFSGDLDGCFSDDADGEGVA